MFLSWLISLVSACFQVSILMGNNVETTPVPKDGPPPVSTQSSKTNHSGTSDIDYEVYAYYLPFLKEQNVSNEEADYSYYENDYLSYYSYDKSVDDENNPNHLPDEDDAAWISRETEVTTSGYQDVTELKTLSKTASDELPTAKTVVTTNELQQNAPERKNPSTMPAMKDVAFLREARYVIDDSLQDVTEPYRPENYGLKSMYYNGINITETSLNVTEPDYLPKTKTTINYLDDDDVESGSNLNGTKDAGAKELDAWNICLIPVEEGSSYSLLFPCSSLEMQPACVGLDHRIGACSDISDVKGTSRRICVKKENAPSVIPCNDPSSEAFCFESSAKDRIIPCQDDRKKVCLFEKGHLEICSAVGYDKLAF